MHKDLTTQFNGISGAVRWGKRIFLACGLDGLKVFELNGDEVNFIAHLTDFPAFDLALRDGFVAVAAGKKGIVLLDTESLRPMRILLPNFPVHSISWSQNRLVAHSVLMGNNHSIVF